jgi:hypothetical protein
VNPDRLICGLATLFGTMAHRGVFWSPRMFADWLNGPTTAIPLRVNHSVLAIERSGLVITNVGVCRQFATTTEPRNGLLTLAEIDDGPWGDALLEDVERHMNQEWMPAYGMSIACHEIPGAATHRRVDGGKDSLIVARSSACQPGRQIGDAAAGPSTGEPGCDNCFPLGWATQAPARAQSSDDYGQPVLPPCQGDLTRPPWRPAGRRSTSYGSVRSPLRARSGERRRSWPVANLINCSSPHRPTPPERPPNGPSNAISQPENTT